MGIVQVLPEEIFAVSGKTNSNNPVSADWDAGITASQHFTIPLLHYSNIP
jgi:hypothetical protein